MTDCMEQRMDWQKVDIIRSQRQKKGRKDDYLQLQGLDNNSVT
jgi:hypothetical protein